MKPKMIDLPKVYEREDIEAVDPMDLSDDTEEVMVADEATDPMTDDDDDDDDTMVRYQI